MAFRGDIRTSNFRATRIFSIASSKHNLPYEDRNPLVINAKTVQEQFPFLRSQDPPYWNPDDVWMASWVYVLDVTPPSYHPYGHRVIYIGDNNLGMAFSWATDRKGEFWKTMYDAHRCFPSDDGFIDPDTGKVECYYLEGYGNITDHQRRHATYFWVPLTYPMNTVGVNYNDFGYDVLEQAGR